MANVKWTYEKIKKFIEIEDKNGCKLLMTYEEFEKEKIIQNKTGSKIKLKIQCGCEEKTVFYTSFEKFNFRNKRQCNKCGQINSQKKQAFPYEIVKNYIEIESNSGCKLLSEEYINEHCQLEIECNCGKTFLLSFREFKQRKQKCCNECLEKTIWNYYKILEFVCTNSTAKLLSKKYENYNTPLLFKCECGKKFETTLSKFIRQNKRQCNKCTYKPSLTRKNYGNIKITNLNRIKNNRIWYEDEIRQYVTNNEPSYDVLDIKHEKKYNCNKLFVLLQCEEKSHDPYWVDWNSFIQGCRCKLCFNEKMSIEKTKDNEVFIQEVKSLVNDEYIFLEDYKDATTSIKVKHNISSCGYEYLVRPNNFLSGNRCPKCHGFYKTTDEFKDQIYQLYGNEYTIISNYNGSTNYVTVKHEKCGHKYQVKVGNILQGRGCPMCNEPHGELKISNFLKNNSINFVPQKEFDNLLGTGGRNLSYDFYLPEYNILIEHQGQQHEKPVDFNGKGMKLAVQKFEKQQEHDRRKKEYAETHNIKLLEIWYKDYDNIEKILENYLNNVF